MYAYSLKNLKQLLKHERQHVHNLARLAYFESFLSAVALSKTLPSVRKMCKTDKTNDPSASDPAWCTTPLDNPVLIGLWPKLSF